MMKQKKWTAVLNSSVAMAIGVLALHRGAIAQQRSFDGGTVVDYPDAAYTEGGDWESVTGSYYTNGQSFSDVRRSGQQGAWAQWSIKVPDAGKYRVYYWHVARGNGTAKIDVIHNGQTDTLTRDLEFGHIGWTSLGDFDAAAGGDLTVKMTRVQGNVLVDAVKFIPVASVKPPAPLPPYPKPDGTSPHLDEKGNLILNGKPYPVFYQELCEDTAATNDAIPYLDETFDIAQAQGVNTLGTTLLWRNFETSKGVYDYTMIDALIDRARQRNMHLSLILFFAWRNLQSYYVPQYIARDHATYLFNKKADGTEGNPVQVSPFADATREAELAALKALFQRVKEKDPDHQVVIMAQLENEMPCARDYSAPAKAAWSGPVPAELTKYFQDNLGTMYPMLANAWTRNGQKTTGTWAEVFGSDNWAGRIFAAWYMGKYIESQVQELKKVLDIPLYANAWQHESTSALEYMDVFHAAAPSLDAMGPDAYGDLDKWENDVGLSWRSWQRMAIAEQHHTANTLWRAVGNYNAFISGEYYGVEGGDWLATPETYQTFENMYPLIAERRGSREMTGFFQSHHLLGERWSEYFNDLKLTYVATVRPHTFLGFNKEAPGPCEKANNITLSELDGCGLVMSLGNGEYLLTATRADIELRYINGGKITAADAQVGHFDHGTWIADGPAEIDQQDDRIRFSFPTENRKYKQIRFKLTSTAANPTMVFEAERGERLKGAELFYSYAASGAFGVTGMKSEGAGVRIATAAPFAAKAVTIRYAVDHAVKARILVEGGASQDVDFPITGSNENWSLKTIPLEVPSGASVTIQGLKGPWGPNIDCILLSQDPPATN